MAGGFRELEGITADVGIEAWGATVEEAFIHTGDGLASLISDRDTLSHELTKEIEVSADDLPGLLVNFLNEIIFLVETEGFLPLKNFSLRIKDSTLVVSITGCTYHPGTHFRNIGVKAATYHGLVIHEASDGVTIKVIFDV
ncbi:archease [bacterium]|nr:MAG: archease [bacterium]